MPAFMRQWSARQGHEAALHQGLVAAHERLGPRIPYLMESIVYREHPVGRELVSMAVYDDALAAESVERRALLGALDRVATEHATGPVVSQPLEMLYEFTLIAQAGAHSIATLFTARPDAVAAMGAALVRDASELVDRFSPTRILVGRAVEPGNVFVFIADSGYPLDLDRYLASSLRRQHVSSVEPFLAGPPRWYALDPVFRYFRAGRR